MFRGHLYIWYLSRGLHEVYRLQYARYLDNGACTPEFFAARMRVAPTLKACIDVKVARILFDEFLSDFAISTCFRTAKAGLKLSAH